MKKGCSLLLSAMEGDDAGARRSHMELADPARVDGMILTEPKQRDERVSVLREMGLPFVFLGFCPDPAVSWVSGDNREGAAKAVRYLIELGHKRIGCITGPLDQTASAARYGGYEQALSEAGLRVDRNLVISGDFTQAGGHEAMHELLSGGLGISAVFVSNDVMAFGALKALREEGLSVPADISVVGFDGISMSRYTDPSLTTVRQPIAELGRKAVEILITMIEGGSSLPAHLTLPVEIQVGESSGPAPAVSGVGAVMG
jgi:LacI family transcriptional regulator